MARELGRMRDLMLLAMPLRVLFIRSTKWTGPLHGNKHTALLVRDVLPTILWILFLSFARESSSSAIAERPTVLQR